MMFMPSIRNDFDLFDDVFKDPFFPTSTNGLMRTDVSEKDGKYTMTMDLPGFRKEDIRMSLKDGNLTISAQHHESNEEKDKKGNIIRQERYSGACSRTFYVGEKVKEEDIHASFKDGELTVEVPDEKALPDKKEEEKYIAIE